MRVKIGKPGKLFLSIPLAFGFLMIAFSSYASEVTIKAGTPIPVRLEEAVDSETTTAGQTVRFLVTRDVSVDDIVVIYHFGDCFSDNMTWLKR